MRILRSAVSVAAASLAGCGGGPSATAPVTTPPATVTVFPGFDTSIYPGDAALSAWRYPASPYYWSGYYLPAPCHRDVTWAGKYTTLTTMGWGLAAIYVGQQDWSQIPQSVVAREADVSARSSQSIATEAVTCS